MWPAKRFLKEFRLDDCESVNVGDIIKADTFADGDMVDVSGTSKGKGYAGTVKRYNNATLESDPRHRPCRPARRFYGRVLRPVQNLQGQKNARPLGRRDA